MTAPNERIRPPGTVPLLKRTENRAVGRLAPKTTQGERDDERFGTKPS